MKFGFLTVSYSGQFYDGPALPLVEQIRDGLDESATTTTS